MAENGDLLQLARGRSKHPKSFQKKKKIGEEVSCCSHNVSLRVVWNCVHWCEEGGDGLQEAIRGVVRKGGD